jgi:hypothetical protein
MTLDEHCPSVGMAQQAACLPQMAWGYQGPESLLRGNGVSSQS